MAYIKGETVSRNLKPSYTKPPVNPHAERFDPPGKFNNPVIMGLDPRQYDPAQKKPSLAKAWLNLADNVGSLAGVGIKPSVLGKATWRGLNHPVRAATKPYLPPEAAPIPAWGGRIEDIAPDNLLRVFHGTAKTFEKYRPSGLSEGAFNGQGYNAMGQGVYVTSNPALASRYAEMRGQPATIGGPPKPGLHPQVKMHLVDRSKLYNPFDKEASRQAMGMTKARWQEMERAIAQSSDRNTTNKILASYGFEGQNQQGAIVMFDSDNLHPWHEHVHLLNKVYTNHPPVG